MPTHPGVEGLQAANQVVHGRLAEGLERASARFVHGEGVAVAPVGSRYGGGHVAVLGALGRCGGRRVDGPCLLTDLQVL